LQNFRHVFILNTTVTLSSYYLQLKKILTEEDDVSEHYFEKRD